MKSKPAHSHGWLVGNLGLVVGLSLTVGFPKLKAAASEVDLSIPNEGTFNCMRLAVLQRPA